MSAPPGKPVLQIATGDGVTPYFDLQVTLEGTTYTLEFAWNVRLGAWFMSILDETGTIPILMGIRVVANLLLGSNAPLTTPPGAFMAYDTSGQGLDPGFVDLGDRVKLIYFTKAQLGI